MAELTDIFDKNGKRTGRTILRGEKLGSEDYIQASVAIVQVKGYILVTKRHPNKTQGNMWEFPGGGSKTQEEPPATLLRELEEETGIRARSEQISELRTVYFAPYRLFVHVFLVEADVKPESLRLQPTEVIDAKFVTPKELAMMQDTMTPMNRQIYGELSGELW